MFGRAQEWFFIELLVFYSFLLTMSILMIKSRFMNIGIDNSAQFDPVYMSHMVNRIIRHMEFDWEIRGMSKARNKKLFTSKKESFVELEGVKLLVNLTEADYEEARDGVLMQDLVIVTPERAADWMRRNIPGNITKEELDYARFREIQSLDMMQNSSIIYHCESVLECQIISLLICFYFEGSLWLSAEVPEEKVEMVVNFRCIFFLLLFEHIFSYTCHMFRNYDIKRNGTPDVNGVLRAQTESFLKSIETFADCMLFGYVLKTLFDTSEDL